MSTKKKSLSTRRIAINAVMIAIYVVLRYFNIPVGNMFRFTLAPFSVILCALLFGPIDGLLVGFLGELLSQLLSFGPTPTTLLWCAGETVRGGTLGLCAWLFLRKWLLNKESLKPKQMVILFSCCVVTGVLASLCQTFALYVDSKMLGYYTDLMVFGVMAWRILVYAVMSVLFGYLCLPIITGLRKAKIV